MASQEWRLREVYDLDTGELIVDEIAIARAVLGQRGEGRWITQTEAVRAAQIMMAQGVRTGIIAERIGCDKRLISRWSNGELPTRTLPTKPGRKRKRSAEYRKAELERLRAWRATMTPEERKAYRKKESDRQRAKRAARTPAEREAYNASRRVA